MLQGKACLCSLRLGFMGLRLAEDRNSESFHGEGRRLAAEDSPELPSCQHRASGRRRSQPSEGMASVMKMNCEVDLEQEPIAAP